MKSNLLYKVFAIILLIPLIALIFAGCVPKSSEQLSESSQTASEDASSASPEASSAPEESVPTGEPTFLIGMDGKAILTSEIKWLDNTDKTAETLTKDDLWAEAYCEGFTYLKEPAPAYYSTYKNPELFDEFKFIGEAEENKNAWRRVNVGDEICGFKVAGAAAHFVVNDWEEYKFPERYFDASQYTFCMLEGTAELEGYLQVTSEAALYSGMGGKVYFYPCESKLPIMPPCNVEDNEIGFVSRLSNGVVFNNVDIMMFSELDCFSLGEIDKIGWDTVGLRKGDVAYARVKLDNISLSCGGGGTAWLLEVELLSDVLAHNDDETERREPAPTR